jgi:predicted component of type VI protein secretion system
MKLSLVVMTEGKQQGKVLPITLAQFLIGRDPQCHLRPASPLISKRHCALIQRDNKVFVRDFDSTNGTLLNEQPVKGEVELHNDDQLKIGPLHFGVRLEVVAPAPAAARPAPAPAAKAAAPAGAAKAATPAKPAAKPAAAPAGAAPAAESEDAIVGAAEGDDDIAAMLLSLGDDTDTGGTPISSGEVPDGSTVMDVPAQPGSEGAGKDAKDKKKDLGNTSTAAKSILEKYMRRPRS